MSLVALCVGCGVASAQSPTVVGSGSDESFLVIESSLFSATLVYDYKYTYNPSELLDTHDMLVAIDAADPNISFDFINYGTVVDPNYFLNAVTYNTVTATNTPSPDYSPYWVQWVSGGEGGYPVAGPIDSGTWSYGSGISAPYRTLAPESWDGFIYNDGILPPSVSPVIPIPEASTGCLILAGVLLLIPFSKKCLPKKISVR
ncbi:MAG: hypothetical protein ABI443_12480 [Chthoniobacterales bacterium]